MSTKRLAIAALVLCLPLGLYGQGKGKGKAKGGQEDGHKGGQKIEKVKGGEEHGKSDVKIRVQDTRPQVVSQRPEKALKKEAKRVEHEQKKLDHDIAKAAKANRPVELREVGGDVMPRTIVLFTPMHGRPAHTIAFADVPVLYRPYILSTRPEERLAGKAIALALNNGADPNALILERLSTGGVVIRNPAGVALLGFDQASASNMGAWRVVNVNDNVKSDAPSFCRSGAGHPVWGRQWCIDKGFGLGTENNIRWASTPVSNIVFAQQPTTEQLITTAVLRQVLGPTAFDRLATHAITLGLVNPLTATWLGQPTDGSRTLYVQSGTYPVAEFVDVNRDGRPETLLVVTKPN